eukprot:jgi/Ulvmu1/841/UM010_0215.1
MDRGCGAWRMVRGCGAWRMVRGCGAWQMPARVQLEARHGEQHSLPATFDRHSERQAPATWQCSASAVGLVRDDTCAEALPAAELRSSLRMLQCMTTRWPCICCVKMDGVCAPMSEISLMLCKWTCKWTYIAR